MKKRFSVLFFVLIILLVFLPGCSSVERLETFSMPWEKTPLALDPTPPEKMEKVVWIVINPNNQKTIFDELKDAGGNPVLIGLTEKEFKDLAVNMSKMLKNIKLNTDIINRYKDYYE